MKRAGRQNCGSGRKDQNSDTVKENEESYYN